MADDDDREPDEIIILKVVSIAHGSTLAERTATPVDLQRWLQLIARDDSLQAVDHVLGRSDDGAPVRPHRRPGSVLWSGHPDKRRVTFVPRRGGVNLFVQDPEDCETDTDGFGEVDLAALAKCEELAVALGAKVFVDPVEIPVWHS